MFTHIKLGINSQLIFDNNGKINQVAFQEYFSSFESSFIPNLTKSNQTTNEDGLIRFTITLPVGSNTVLIDDHRIVLDGTRHALQILNIKIIATPK